MQPLRATYRYVRVAGADDPTHRYTYIECLSNLRNTNGQAHSAHQGGPPLHRLLRPPLGAKLGKVF